MRTKRKLYKSYTREFKLEAIRLMDESGRPASDKKASTRAFFYCSGRLAPRSVLGEARPTKCFGRSSPHEVFWARQDLLAALALRVDLKVAQDSCAILVNRLRNKPCLLLNLNVPLCGTDKPKRPPQGRPFWFIGRDGRI